MSLMDMDEKAERRMVDYMKPEDLNTEACVALAEVILGEASTAMTHAVRQYNAWPSSENKAHLRNCQKFYRGPVFAALSCGMADGETVIRELTRQALLGRNVRGGAVCDGLDM